MSKVIQDIFSSYVGIALIGAKAAINLLFWNWPAFLMLGVVVEHSKCRVMIEQRISNGWLTVAKNRELHHPSLGIIKHLKWGSNYSLMKYVTSRGVSTGNGAIQGSFFWRSMTLITCLWMASICVRSSTKPSMMMWQSVWTWCFVSLCGNKFLKYWFNPCFRARVKLREMWYLGKN